MSQSDPHAFRTMCRMMAQWIEASKNQTELANLLNTTIDEYQKMHPETTVSQTLVEISPGFAQAMLKTLLPQARVETAKADFEYVVVSNSEEDAESQKRFSPVRPPSAASIKSGGSEKKSEEVFETASDKGDAGGCDEEAELPVSSRNFNRAPASSVRSSHANLARQSIAVSQSRSKSPTCLDEGIDGRNAQEVFKSILNHRKYWPEKSMSDLLWSPAPTLAVFIIHALLRKLNLIVRDILKTDKENSTGEFSRGDCLAIFTELSCPVSTDTAKQIFDCIATAQVKLLPNKAAVPV